MRDDDDRPIGHSNSCVQKNRRSVDWIWEGVLATDAVTLLSAPKKVGKTTLLSLLLDRRRAGGQLLGRAVEPGKTVLCCEENENLWALRQPPLDFGPELIFHQPEGDCPTLGRWKRFIADLFDLGFQDDPFDLMVIDTAMSFMPITGRNKRRVRWAFAQLADVASLHAAVLILNQSRSMYGALAAFADIVIDMAIPRLHTPLSPYGIGAGGKATRRRTFTGVGRYPGTLQHVAADLNAEGTDYVLVTDGPPEAGLGPTLETLRQLLRESPGLLTRLEILARWPEGEPPPRADSLWRCLARGCELGMLVRTGAGNKAEAFRYGLAQGGVGG